MNAVGFLNGNSQHARQTRAYLVDKNTSTLRRHLEIYLQAAENKMRNGLALPTGDMWTRGWIEAKEYREQINLLDATGGM